jgi:hypothetical protein
MINFLTACASYALSEYNNTSPSDTLIPGSNFFVGVVPQTPDQVVCFLPSVTPADRRQPVRRLGVQVIVRSKNLFWGERTGLAIYGLFDTKTNVVTGFPGRFLPETEFSQVGYDENRRLVFSSDFTLTTVGESCSE